MINFLVCELQMMDLTTDNLLFMNSPSVTVTPADEFKIFGPIEDNEDIWIRFTIPSLENESPVIDQVSLTVSDIETVTLAVVNSNGTVEDILTTVSVPLNYCVSLYMHKILSIYPPLCSIPLL